MRSRIILAVLLMSLLSITACRSKNEPKVAQADNRATVAVAAVSAGGTVESIDHDQRTVTIKMTDGEIGTYHVPEDAVNFDQIKPGDQITATLMDSVAVAVRKSTEPAGAAKVATVALAPKGAKPGMIISKTLELTAKVEAVDVGKRTLTLEEPSGRSKKLEVGPDVNLEALKKGDDVIIRYTQALALLDRVPQISGTPVGSATTKPSAADAQAVATDAYIYGYPLVTMDVTRQVMTNAAMPQAPHAPMGQFANMREYPNASFKDVTAPNADTLYSAAWINVAQEPYVLHIPDMGDRYYLMPMLDAWTNVFASPGKRTGVREGDFAITGPGWKGKLPEGVKEVKSPTAMVWIIGRIYCTGKPEDYQAVHELQDKLALTPLSAWGKPYTAPEGKVDPAVDMKMPPRDQVNKMEAGAFFSRLAMLMKDNPPAKADEPMVAKLAKIGITPGREFDAGKLDPATAKALQAGHQAALKRIVADVESGGKRVNGWEITLTGDYGTNYPFRAAVAYAGLGANLSADACYPMAKVDADGKPFDGANRYVWHFNSKGDLPPVNGFWSLTMYNSQFFFVENPLNRYTLSERNDLKPNADGSIDMYIQKDNPGPEKEANWLPAPSDQFVLMLRMYWPKQEFLDGKWAPPAVKRVEAISGTPVGPR